MTRRSRLFTGDEKSAQCGWFSTSRAQHESQWSAISSIAVWSKYSNAQRVSSLHLSKGRLKVLSNWAGV